MLLLLFSLKTPSFLRFPLVCDSHPPHSDIQMFPSAMPFGEWVIPESCSDLCLSAYVFTKASFLKLYLLEKV